jgi:hypothetical protein
LTALPTPTTAPPRPVAISVASTPTARRLVIPTPTSAHNASPAPTPRPTATRSPRSSPSATVLGISGAPQGGKSSGLNTSG